MRQAEALKPDVILMDLRMPDMDGGGVAVDVEIAVVVGRNRSPAHG